MRVATKEESIRSIKSLMRSRLRKKGVDLKTISEKFLNDKAEEIYKNRDAEIMILGGSNNENT